MASNPHVRLSARRSPNPQKQMAKPLIRKALINARDKNILPNIPRAPPIRTKVTSRALKVEQVCALRERDGSLKSGKQVMKLYTQILASEIHVQSVHVGDTCLLLDPLLRTHKSSVLGCFMNHHGLHILHALLRRFSQHKFDEGRSVLRKLLRVLQHLENCEMLTVEHLTCHSPRFCVHKFCKLLFKLADCHEDSEVRTLACIFQGLRFSVWIQPHRAHETCLWWEQVLAS